METLRDKIKLDNNDNYILFEQGGIGKTSQMKAVFQSYALSHKDGIVPIFVDCKTIDFNRKQPLLTHILLEFCGEDCSYNYENSIVRLENMLTKANSKYKYVFFIDGINECENNKYLVVQDIAKLLKSPNNKIIVSSRINENDIGLKDFKRLKVKEFTDAQIVTFLNSKGFKDNGNDVELNRLNPSLLKILRVPMFLKVFVETYSADNIFPDMYTGNIVRKADLLQAFINKIFDDKNEQHSSENDPEYIKRQFSLERYLPALAYEMMLMHKYSINNEVLKNLRTQVFNLNYFERFENEDEVIFESISSFKIINNICIKEFSLLNKSNDNYAFSHQVWQDFFCGKFYELCIKYDVLEPFENAMPESVKQFIGEIIGECDFENKNNLDTEASPIEMFLQKHNLQQPENKQLSAISTRNLVEIMKTSRNNNITADYSYLDLTKCNLIKCSYNNSIFAYSKIDYLTFIPDGHTSWINSIYLTKDNNIISASRDKTLRIWSTQTEMQICDPLEKHSDSIVNVTMDSNEKYIFSCGDDCNIYIWNYQSREIKGEPYKKHNCVVTAVVVHPTKPIAFSSDANGTIRIWNYYTLEDVINPIKAHNGWINSITLTNNGKYLISGGDDCFIRIWNSDIGEQIGNDLIGHTSWICSLKTLNDNKTLISAGDNTVRFWDIENQCEMNPPLYIETKCITYAIVTPDNEKLVLSDNNGKIYVFDYLTQEALCMPFELHKDWVNSMCVTSDSAILYTASWDKTIRKFDLQYYLSIGDGIVGNNESIRVFGFNKQNSKIYGMVSDRTICSWDLYNDLKIEKNVLVIDDDSYLVKFQNNSDYCFYAKNNNSLYFFNLNTNELIGPIGDFDDQITDCILLEEKRIFVICSLDGTFKIYNYNGKMQYQYACATGFKFLTVRNNILVATKVNGEFIVLDLLNYDIKAEIVEYNGKNINALDINDKWIYFCYNSNEIVGINYVDKDALVFNGHTDWIDNVCLIDDEFLLSTSYDNKLKIWNVNKSICIKDITIDPNRIVSDNSKTREWSVDFGIQIGINNFGSSDWRNYLALSSDKKIIAIGNKSGLKVLNLNDYTEIKFEKYLVGNIENAIFKHNISEMPFDRNKVLKKTLSQNGAFI